VGSFNESLTRLRRFLRDPSGNIWTTDLLRRAWNETQFEILQKVGMIEEVAAYSYPPKYTWCYIHDWEDLYAEGDKYQALNLWQADSKVISYPWESVYWVTEDGPSDDGARFTIPFESAFLAPGDYVPMPLHTQFHNAKFVAWDESPISPISQKELAEQDWNYRIASGTPAYYWRPDVEHNQFVLYPRPSAITWQEEGVPEGLVAEGEEGAWTDTELDGAMTDTGEDGALTEVIETGIVAWAEGDLDQADLGLITGTVGAAGAVLMVYERLAYDVADDPASWDDELDLPEFVLHYIEAGTLERAFSADNDGFVPSLRDFWKVRKEIGINALKTYKRNRLKNRDYCIGAAQGGRRMGSRLRLPSSYPRG
jgi:hypothetical protein